MVARKGGRASSAGLPRSPPGLCRGSPTHNGAIPAMKVKPWKDKSGATASSVDPSHSGCCNHEGVLGKLSPANTGAVGKVAGSPPERACPRTCDVGLWPPSWRRWMSSLPGWGWGALGKVRFYVFIFVFNVLNVAFLKMSWKKGIAQ